jgi:formylmethanofuran dehydrogenase subunit E
MTETIKCTRCGDDVESETSLKLGDAIICEICWDDL